MENRSLPKNIDYSDVLPQSVPAIQRRRKFYPANGSNFSNLSNKQIRIELSSANALLDPTNSYIEFDLTTLAGGPTLGLDIGGGAVLFETLSIEQGGRVLTRCSAYNRLNAGVLSTSQESFSGRYTNSITGFERGGNLSNNLTAPIGVGGRADVYANLRHNSNVQIAAGSKIKLTMPVLSGLFTQDKLIPLPMVSKSSPLTIVLDICPQTDIGIWSADPVAAGDCATISNISYVASLIEVGGDVLNQLTMMRDEMMGGQLAISGQDWEHNTGQLDIGDTGIKPINIPARKRSLKSLFWLANSESVAGNIAGFGLWMIYNLSYAGCANVDNFQIKAGSVSHPPEPIIGFRADQQEQRGEALMELSKALGQLGFNKPCGIISSINYSSNAISAPTPAGIQPGQGVGDNGSHEGPPGHTLAPNGNVASNRICVCPFGIDLDAFQHTAIEAGLDTKTLAENTNLLLDISPIGPGLEAKTIHTWMVYDQHYYFNRDGNITFSN